MNLHTLWAERLIDALGQAGVVDAVICPGARATPFVLASAARLRCHDVIDERSAAFFALGQARASGRPTLLLCTSGSAGAHAYPAVLEAAHSHVPLIVLTADRPWELQRCDAPQTLDQARLFGAHAAYFDLGLPEPSEPALRALLRSAVQAVLAAQHPAPGPVQINAPLRKPLEPQKENAEDLAFRALACGVPVARPPRLLADPGALEALVRACRAATRGVLVFGPAPMAQASDREAMDALSRATGFPLLAEATSQLRFTGADHPGRCDAFDALYRSPRFRASHAPDLVVAFGAAPLSSGLERLLEEDPGCPRFVVAAHGWNDPQSLGATHVLGDPGEVARAVWGRLGGAGAATQAWSRELVRHGARALEIAAELDDRTLGEVAVARIVTGALPRGSVLGLGNSLPIRMVETFCAGRLADALVFAQRGLNGIDGLVSGVAGAAAASGRAATLLVGDVSFVHDLGGLFAAREANRPIVIVVVQNQGGRIFEELPLGQSPGETFERHFVMPPRIDIAAAAAMFGHAYQRAETRAELGEAITSAHRRGGCSVIEAVVPAHGAARERARYFAAVDAAF